MELAVQQKKKKNIVKNSNETDKLKAHKFRNGNANRAPYAPRHLCLNIDIFLLFSVKHVFVAGRYNVRNFHQIMTVKIYENYKKKKPIPSKGVEECIFILIDLFALCCVFCIVHFPRGPRQPGCRSRDWLSSFQFRTFC